MSAGEIMYIPAGVAHAFKMKQYTEFLELTDLVLGEEGEWYDEDTVDVELVTP